MGTAKWIRHASEESPSFVGTRHGLNTKPDEHAAITADTVLTEGETFVDGRGQAMVGPLDWKVLPTRYGPPVLTMELHHLVGLVERSKADGWDDELVLEA